MQCLQSVSVIKRILLLIKVSFFGGFNNKFCALSIIAVHDETVQEVEYLFCNTVNLDAYKFQQYRYYLVFFQVRFKFILQSIQILRKIPFSSISIFMVCFV